MVTKIMVFPSGHPLGGGSYVKVVAKDENQCNKLFSDMFGLKASLWETPLTEKQMQEDNKSCVMEIHKIGEANAIIFPKAGVVVA